MQTPTETSNLGACCLLLLFLLLVTPPPAHSPVAIEKKALENVWEGFVGLFRLFSVPGCAGEHMADLNKVSLEN